MSPTFLQCDIGRDNRLHCEYESDIEDWENAKFIHCPMAVIDDTQDEFRIFPFFRRDMYMGLQAVAVHTVLPWLPYSSIDQSPQQAERFCSATVCSVIEARDEGTRPPSLREHRIMGTTCPVICGHPIEIAQQYLEHTERCTRLRCFFFSIFPVCLLFIRIPACW